MAIYEYDKKPENTQQPTIQIKEIPIYGGSRLGQYRTSYTNQVADKKTALGQRVYEFANHLQNVLVVLADFKVPVGTDGTATEFKAIVVSANDYYPFGMVMEGRKYYDPNYDYRYGFNGKEDDKDFGSNLQDFDARFYNAAIGRWLSVDPLRHRSPDMTPYRFGFNNPIRYLDPDGKWEEDGHFWTVFAFAVSVGLDINTAYIIAQQAEAPDHIVIMNGDISNLDFTLRMRPHPDYIWANHGADGGLGTWAERTWQMEMHGLTGGLQSEVLQKAFYKTKNIRLEYLHLLGDAWAHSYVDKNGVRKMFGDKVTRTPIGRITLQHKFYDENGKFRWFSYDPTDQIALREEEYTLYTESLQKLFSDPEFSAFSAKKANKEVFSYYTKTWGKQVRKYNIFPTLYHLPNLRKVI